MLVGLVWAAMLVAIVRQPVFVASDMASNHAHIWYVADRLWHGHGVPLRMRDLASGDAYTFPYAFPPWLLGAVLWPLAGDRVVTVMLVVAAVAVIAATYWALPRLRRGWWAVVVLLNPSLIASVMLGQLPFLCAAAALMVAVGMWRRDRPVWATAMTALAIVIHPAVLLPITVVAVLFALPTERHRGRLLLCWAIAVVVAVPAIGLTLVSPVVDETSFTTQMFSLWTTVGIRILVPAIPLFLDVLAAHWPRATALPVSLGGLCVVLVALAWVPFQLDIGWSALVRTRMPHALATLNGSAALHPGRVYRVLIGPDQKYELYTTLRRGAVLDGELFPESLHRQGFGGAEEYARFLSGRRVESVVVTPGYASHFGSNEPALVRSLAASGACVAGVRLRAGPTGPGWQVYDVSRC